MTNSIGAYLRIGFQAGLASAEHVSYREFIGAVPEKSYLGSVKIEPIGAAALIQMDMALAFPLIDVLLGGEGVGQPPSREITEIEEQILETIMRIICRELQNVWQALGVQFVFEQRQQPGRVQHLLPVEEKTLGLSFELSMKNCRGLMSIAVPAVVSGALLRKISAGRPRSQTQMGSEEAAERLRQRLLTCPFHLDLQLDLLTSSAKDLADLVPGRMLILKHRADGIAELVSEERTIFQAKVARVGNSRAAQVMAAAKNNSSWRNTMASPAEPRPNPAHKFMQLWAESLSLVLGQIAGVPFPMMPAEATPEKPAVAETDVLLTATIAGPAPGELSFRVPLVRALILAKLFMQEESAPAELTADGRSALEELFRQVAGYVATSGRATLPGIAVTVALGETPTWAPASSGWIDSATGAPESIAIEWKMSAALSAALTSPPTDAVATAGIQYLNTSGETPGTADLDKLGFFMDLELEVTLRFGGRNLLLKDVLELGPGSVLELDREVQDPADLLLDGKLIARGEVVMVNGNYGLRVSEVFTAPRAAA